MHTFTKEVLAEMLYGTVEGIIENLLEQCSKYEL